MAREVIIKTWCDPCLADEQATEGTELPPLTMPGLSKPRVIALCEVHRKELYEPLAEALREWGQIAQPDGTTAPEPRKTRTSLLAGGEHKCPVPDCDYPGGPSRNALDQHCRSHHGASLPKILGKPTVQCSHPGCEVEMTHPSGWTTHWSRSHSEVNPKPKWPGLPEPENATRGGGRRTRKAVG